MSRSLMFAVLVVVIVALAGGAVFLHARANRPDPNALPADTYIAPATRADIVQSVSSPGTISSNLDVAIKCQASGEITKIPFDISDHVKKGDVIMQLDPVDEQVLVDQATATVAQAESKLTEARQAATQASIDLDTAREKADADIVSAQITADNLQKKADRQKTLMAKNLASPEDFETAQSDAATAANTLAAAKIAKEEIKSQEVALETRKEDINLAQDQVDLDSIVLKNAKQQYSYCTVYAPMDGVVADIPTTIGIGTVIASAISNIGGGTTIMTLSDMSRIFVLATVDESDIGDVQVGQTVDISADAFPTKHFTGKIVRIAPQGVSASAVVTFEVKIEVTSENKSLLKPQMTASANIIEAEHDNVLTVPLLAVVHQPHRSYVTVQLPGGATVDKDVVVGINDLDNIEIVSGLNEGDQVLVHKNESSSKWTGQQQGQRPLTMPRAGGRR